MRTVNFEFDYLDNVIDTVTGHNGVVTGVAYYFNESPTQYLVEGKDTTGRPISEWVIARRLNREEKRNETN